MRIGSAKPDDTGNYDITIRTATLSIDCKAVPNKDKAEGRPAFIIIERDGFEIGAAWAATKAGQDGRRDVDYLRVRFDSPELPDSFSVLLWPVRVPAGAYDVVFERRQSDAR